MTPGPQGYIKNTKRIRVEEKVFGITQKCLWRRPQLDYASLPWPERMQWVLAQLQNLGSSVQSENAGVSYKMQEKKLFPFIF